MSECGIRLLSGRELDNSAAQSNRNGVCPIIGAKLGEYVGDMAPDRRFPDRELVGNLFVGIPSGN
jgi:hypothetical protein